MDVVDLNLVVPSADLNLSLTLSHASVHTCSRNGQVGLVLGAGT